MPQTIVIGRGTPAIRAMFIALLVTVVVLGAIALVVWAWPHEDATVTTTGFGEYPAGDPPVMGDVHYTPPVPAGFGTYEPGSPPIMRDPDASAFG